MATDQNKQPASGNDSPMSGHNPTDRNSQRSNDAEHDAESRSDKKEKEPAGDKDSKAGNRPGTGVNDNRNASDYRELNRGSAHDEEKDITV